MDGRLDSFWPSVFPEKKKDKQTFTRGIFPLYTYRDIHETPVCVYIYNVQVCL